MADQKKISELDETTTLIPATDVAPVVNSSVTKKITVNNLVSSGLSASFNTQLSSSMNYPFFVGKGALMTGSFDTLFSASFPVRLTASMSFPFLVARGVSMTGTLHTQLTSSMTVNFLRARGIALTGSTSTVFSGTVERKVNIRTITGNGPILPGDHVLLVSGTANIVLTASSPTANYEPVLIKKIATNAFIIEIARSGSEMIEGVAATYQLTGSELTTRPGWTLLTDGTNHWIG